MVGATLHAAHHSLWHQFTNWSAWSWPGWTVFVALGTLSLAGFTYVLARATRSSVATAAAQIEVERKRTEASQWPRVFPVPIDRWVRGAEQYAGLIGTAVIPIENGGSGVALNIHGQLDFTNSGGRVVEFVSTNLGAGGVCDIVLDWPHVERPESGDWQGPEREHRWPWTNLRGFLVYEGVAGEVWKTSFEVTTVGEKQYRRIQVTTTEMVKRSDGTVLAAEKGRDPDHWYSSIAR